MFKIGVSLLLAFFLLGCEASEQASDFMSWAPGHSLDDIIECAGKPTDVVNLTNGSSVVQWNYTQPNSSVNTPLLVGVVAGVVDTVMAPIAPLALLAGAGNPSVSASTAGECRVIIVVKDNQVTKVGYSGANNGISGKHSVCAPIIRECLPNYK